MSYEKDFLNIHKNEKKNDFFFFLKLNLLVLKSTGYWVYTIYKTSPHFAL